MSVYTVFLYSYDSHHLISTVAFTATAEMTDVYLGGAMISDMLLFCPFSVDANLLNSPLNKYSRL